jgi:hypothetical protein
LGVKGKLTLSYIMQMKGFVGIDGMAVLKRGAGGRRG